MAKCTTCEAAFFQTSPGVWGDQLCGDCIAMQIQPAILLQLRGSDRKPSRRVELREVVDEAMEKRA